MILGLGIDLVHIPRIKRMVDKYGTRFLERIYTSKEIELCCKRKMAYEPLAVRFAAKEACSKALGTGIRKGISWKQMEILQEDSGKPILILKGNAKKLALQMGATSWMVSLSHEREYATAVVLLQSSS